MTSTKVKLKLTDHRQSDTSPYRNRFNETLLISIRNVHSNVLDNERSLRRSKTIPRSRLNFEILKASRIIAKEWENLDQTQASKRRVKRLVSSTSHDAPSVISLFLKTT